MNISVNAATGMEAIGEIRWGTHLCLLYESNQDLIDTLVSYFRRGLEGNAFCVWLSPVPLGRQVMEALKDCILHFDDYQQKGQIETIPPSRWYVQGGQLSALGAVEYASAALDESRGRGFDGIWLAGDLSWLQSSDWQALISYEESVCDFVATTPAAFLCTYSLHDLNIPQALDLYRTHRSVIARRQGAWCLFESREKAMAKQALRDMEVGYQQLFESMLDGVEVIDAQTGRILVANQAAANIFGFASPEEMIGIDPLQYIPAENVGSVAQMMAEAMFEKDLHKVMELRALRTNGSSVWISAMGVRTRYQSKLAGLVSMRDITEQRNAEKALQESQRDLRAVFDGVRDGIAVFDAEGRAISVNKRILDVGGYSEADIIGKHFSELTMFSTESMAKISPVLPVVAAGEEASPVEMDVMTKSGQGLTLDVRITPLKKDNDTAGYIVVMRDVTARKGAEAALKESEQRYRLITENDSDVIITMDMDSRLTYVSPSVERLVGCSVAEVMARPLKESLTPRSLETAKQAILEKLSQVGRDEESRPSPTFLELEVIRKDGSTVWTEATTSFLYDPVGKLVGMISSVRNIDDRRRAQQAVAESERRYRFLAENVSDVIWVTDAALKTTYISPSVQRLLGFGAEEALGREYDDSNSVPAASVERIQEALASLKAEDISGANSTGLSRPVELELRGKDGSSVWVDTAATVIRGANGDPIQYVGVMHDITERKLTEERLQDGFRRLERVLDGTIQAIRAMVDARDRYTAGHQQRVTELACAIARSMKLSNQQVRAVQIAGLLHDVGKILLPTEILTKPGRLNEIEFAMIRTHPRAGYRILESIEFPWPIARMVLQHHERMNGSGYPDGLLGDDILLEARILAVADVVEAMSSHRPYRASLGLDKALEEIAQKAGVLYDAEVADVCLRVFRVEGFAFKGEAMLAED